MKYIVYLFLVFAGSRLLAQSISPDVLNSAGGHEALGPNGASVTYNVGEPFTETIGAGSPKVTQGFLQPVTVGAYNFTASVFPTDVSCSDKDDGRISTAITTPAAGFKMTYAWTPTVVCPGRNCPSIDSLRSGNYRLVMIATYTNLAGASKTDTILDSLFVIRDVMGPCKVTIFNGVNINGGNNGHLHIDNISEFPNNRLTIYNRWGGQLYDEKGYDNTTKFWPATEDLSKLLPSTYFYVLDLGDGSKPIKGWVELVKN